MFSMRWFKKMEFPTRLNQVFLVISYEMIHNTIEFLARLNWKFSVIFCRRQYNSIYKIFTCYGSLTLDWSCIHMNSFQTCIVKFGLIKCNKLGWSFIIPHLFHSNFYPTFWPSRHVLSRIILQNYDTLFYETLCKA